jgi:hypothetical protein
MDQPVSHPDDFAPRDARMLRLNFVWDPVGSFADDLEQSDDCQVEHAAFF